MQRNDVIERGKIEKKNSNIFKCDHFWKTVSVKVVISIIVA